MWAGLGVGWGGGTLVISRSGVAGEKKKKQMHSAKIMERQFHQLKQGGDGCNLVNGCSVGGWRLTEPRRKSDRSR